MGRRGEREHTHTHTHEMQAKPRARGQLMQCGSPRWDGSFSERRSSTQHSAMPSHAAHTDTSALLPGPTKHHAAAAKAEQPFTHTPPSRSPNVSAPLALSEPSLSRQSSHPPPHPDSGNRYLFPFILLCQIIIYMEAGAVPALLNVLGADFSMSFWSLGLMGGIGYLALSLGCPLATYSFRRWDVPRVLGCAIMLNAAATAVFAMCPLGRQWVWLLIVTRGLIGFSQSYCIIYFPLWCDAHAPPERKTSWMSYVQGGVVIGIFVGYASATIASLFPQAEGGIASWRIPFILQTMLTLPLAILAFAIPSEHCNIRAQHEEEEDSEERYLNGGKERKLSMHQTFSDLGTAHTPGDHVGPYDSSCPGGPGETASSLVANVGSILGPHMILDPVMPSHLEGEAPRNSNPSPWPHTRWGHFAVEDTAADEAERSTEAAQPESYGTFTTPDATVSAAAIDADDDDDGAEHEAMSLGLGSAASASAAPYKIVRNTLVDAPSHPAGSWHTLTTSEGLVLLARNTVYLSTVLSLSFGYFAVIGLSYWSTQFFIDVRGAPESAARAGFIFCALTAPIGGVVFGGWIVDRAGGYSGLVQRTEALKCCCVFLFTGALFAGPAGVLTNLWLCSGAIWMVLFFGSATLPPATGVMLNAVHQDMRPFAAAVATISFNCIGYFGGPLVSGFVMTYTNSFLIGYRVVLWASVPCLLLMVVAWLTSRAQRRARRRAHMRRAEHEARNNDSEQNNMP